MGEWQALTFAGTEFSFKLVTRDMVGKGQIKKDSYAMKFEIYSEDSEDPLKHLKVGK